MADTYKVTGILRTVAAEPGRHAGPAVEITFTTKPHDIVGTVTLPSAVFTTDEAAKAIAAQAAILEAVMEL